MKIATPALAIYLMAGEALPELDAAAVRGGATIIEIGIPFSDPLAEGMTIKAAGHAALDAGMTPRRCLEMVAETRAAIGPATPLVPMTYAPIVEAYGIEASTPTPARLVTGLIVSDIPPEEAGDLAAAAEANGIDLVQLVSLTSSYRRLAQCSGCKPRVHLRCRRNRRDRRTGLAGHRAGAGPARPGARARPRASPPVRLRRLQWRTGRGAARGGRRRRCRRLGGDRGCQPRRRTRSSSSSFCRSRRGCDPLVLVQKVVAQSPSEPRGMAHKWHT